MNNTIVLTTYAVTLVVAAYLAWHFRAVSWYWHVASIIIAVAIALMPPLPAWRGPGYDLLTGAAIVFFFVWGAGFFVERLAHHAWSRATSHRGHHA